MGPSACVPLDEICGADSFYNRTSQQCSVCGANTFIRPTGGCEPCPALLLPGEPMVRGETLKCSQLECPPGWILVGDVGSILGAGMQDLIVRRGEAVCVEEQVPNPMLEIVGADRCGGLVRVQWTRPRAGSQLRLPPTVYPLPAQQRRLDALRERGPWRGVVIVAEGERVLGNVSIPPTLSVDFEAALEVAETAVRLEAFGTGSTDWSTTLQMLDRAGRLEEVQWSSASSEQGADSPCGFVVLDVQALLADSVSDPSAEMPASALDVLLNQTIASERAQVLGQSFASASLSAPILFGSEQPSFTMRALLPVAPAPGETVRLVCAVEPSDRARVIPAEIAIRTDTWRDEPVAMTVVANAFDGVNGAPQRSPFEVECMVSSTGPTYPASLTLPTVHGAVVNEIWPYFEDILVQSGGEEGVWTSGLGRWSIVDGELRSTTTTMAQSVFALTLSGALDLIVVGDETFFLSQGRPQFSPTTRLWIGSIEAPVHAVSSDGRFLLARSPSFSTMCGSFAQCLGPKGYRAIRVENQPVVRGSVREAFEAATDSFEWLGLRWFNATRTRATAPSGRLLESTDVPMGLFANDSLGMGVVCPPACPGPNAIRMDQVANAEASALAAMAGGVYYTDRCVGFATDSSVCLDRSSAKSCAWGAADDCVACPPGGLCPGGYRLWSQPGFWVSSEESKSAVRCPEPSSARCIGWSNGATQCGEGYLQGSAVCAACAPGYFPQLGACAPCPADAGGSRTNPWPTIRRLLIVVAVFAFFGGVMLVTTRCALRRVGLPTSDAGRRVKHMVFWTAVSMQVIATVGKGASAGLPDYLQSMYSFLGVFLLDPSFAAHPDCLQSPPFFTDMLLMALILVLLGVTVALSKCLPHPWPRETRALGGKRESDELVGVKPESVEMAAASVDGDLAFTNPLATGRAGPHVVGVKTTADRKGAASDAIKVGASLSMFKGGGAAIAKKRDAAKTPTPSSPAVADDTTRLIQASAAETPVTIMTPNPLQTGATSMENPTTKLPPVPKLVRLSTSVRHQLFTFLTLLYPITTSTVLNILYCRVETFDEIDLSAVGGSSTSVPVRPVERVVLASNPYIQCYEGTHLYATLLAALVFATYCVGYPLGTWMWVHARIRQNLLWTGPNPSKRRRAAVQEVRHAMASIARSCFLRLRHGWFGIDASSTVEAGGAAGAMIHSPMRGGGPSKDSTNGSWVQRLTPLEAHLWLDKHMDADKNVVDDPNMRHFVFSDFQPSQMSARHVNFLVLFGLSALGTWFRAVDASVWLSLLRFVILAGIVGGYLAYFLIRKPYAPQMQWKSAVRQYSLVLSIMGAFLNWVVYARNEGGMDLFGETGTTWLIAIGSIVVFTLSAGLLLTLFLAYWASLLRSGIKSSAQDSRVVGIVELLHFRTEAPTSGGSQVEEHTEPRASEGAARRTSRLSVARPELSRGLSQSTLANGIKMDREETWRMEPGRMMARKSIVASLAPLRRGSEKR